MSANLHEMCAKYPCKFRGPGSRQLNQIIFYLFFSENKNSTTATATTSTIKYDLILNKEREVSRQKEDQIFIVRRQV